MKSPGLILAMLLIGPLAFATPLEDPPVFVMSWGTFGSGDGQMRYPHGLATDSEGNVYVADQGNLRIQKFSGNGAFIRSWGSFGSAAGQFNSPRGVAVSQAGRVYVIEDVNARVQYFTIDGVFLGGWTSPDSLGEFHNPQALAVDIVSDVYVSDGIRILKFTADGVFLLKWGSFGTGPGQFEATAGIGTDPNGDVYVVDRSGSARIQKFTSSGDFILSWPTLGSPAYLACDQASNIYVTDQSFNRVSKYSSTGVLLAQWGSTGTGNGQFQCPSGVTVDFKENVFVAEPATCSNTYARIQKFSSPTVPVRPSTWGWLKARFR